MSGGNDVFVDIGDKAWGVLACQRYLGGIEGSKTLHIGDQFLSAGANDFKVRFLCYSTQIAVLTRLLGPSCMYDCLDSESYGDSPVT